MRFLADESCDMAVVRALRERGHDVALVRERGAGVKDSTVAQIARQERLILLTEDKDFGQLLYAVSGIDTGVVLLRFPRGARQQIGPAASSAVEALGERLKNAFVVVEPGRFRVTEHKR